MTMRKVREKQYQKRLATISRISRKRVDRVGLAISSAWTVREEPECITELRIERQCLRAEIIKITLDGLKKKKDKSSVLIAERLKRIEVINSQLSDRRK